MSVCELRHDRPSGWFSKSRGLSASVSFLSSPPPPRSFTYAIFERSLTVVLRSLLLNRTVTFATQAITGRFQALLVPKERVVNNLTLDFLSLQDGTAAMDYLENQEYQETPEYLVLGPLGKLDLLVRKVHLANLGQKVFYSN